MLNVLLQSVVKWWDGVGQGRAKQEFVYMSPKIFHLLVFYWLEVQWCQNSLKFIFVFNYVKILDDIHFFVICFVIVFYTSIFRNVFSLICLSYKKCLNNMFWVFFLIILAFFNNLNSYTIACFYTNMVQNLCCYYLQDIFIYHYFFFVAVNIQYDACGLEAHKNSWYNFLSILQLLKYK